ncbi:DUF3644 domain-containing protein [Prevotella sp. AGR2160]|uniref:DUF3644 domain-containing protein n=1 Tax=Prevotella sp. AGR2160 TaxID=1280674 RepID=UPI0004078145|nr:DUF3644 domain-containing protein [Prevotella sp. AGR2160]
MTAAENRRFKRVRGDLQFWELNTCVAKYFIDCNNPIRKNIEFFIPLRNKIEHKFMPELDINIFGECQSLLLNFDTVIEKEFGEEYRIRESLSFALQLFPTSDALVKSVETSKDSEAVMNYITNFRNSISTEILESGQYSFKAFLIQVSNHESKDAIPIQFYRYDQMSEEEKAKIKKIAALVKTKEKTVFSTKDLLKPAKVVKKVQQGLGNPKVERNGKEVDKFNSDTHTRCWKKYKVRPESGSDTPEKVISEYCVYDEANESYLYTEKWVDFLISKMQDEDEYNSLYK